MDRVRESIVFLRSNWERYDEFKAALSARLDRSRSDWAASLSSDTPEKARLDLRVLEHRLDHLFQSRRDWVDREGATPGAGYEAIRIYTSAVGYVLFRAVAKDVFRMASIAAWEDVVAATFFVELLNIDLYNYVHGETGRQNFEGTVYRGINMTREDFDDLSSLGRQPVEGRYFSIPLGMDSSTCDARQATKFLKKDGSVVPVLQRIHVSGLTADLAHAYRRRHPSSVVSTICAVSVKDLSDFAAEDEVLLRGPFFQVLRFSRETVAGSEVFVVETLMLNSNRDHFSTPQGGKNDPARQLFSALVRTRRYDLCADYCRTLGLREDEEAYMRAHHSARGELEKLVAAPPPPAT